MHVEQARPASLGALGNSSPGDQGWFCLPFLSSADGTAGYCSVLSLGRAPAAPSGPPLPNRCRILLRDPGGLERQVVSSERPPRTVSSVAAKPPRNWDDVRHRPLEPC